MKKLIPFVLICILTGCKDKQIDTKAEGEKVMKLSKEWAQSASSGDVEKTLSYWAEDAVLISAGQPQLTGKQEIRQMIEESFNIPGFRISWNPTSVQVSESGDMAYMLEDTEVSFTDSTGHSIIQKNKAVSIWRKKTDGSWENVVDISTPANTQHQ